MIDKNFGPIAQELHSLSIEYHYFSGNYAEAKKIIEETPLTWEFRPSYEKRAIIAYFNKDYKSVESHLFFVKQYGGERNKSTIFCLFLEGVVHFLSKRHRVANATFTKYLSLNPSSLEGMTARAICLKFFGLNEQEKEDGKILSHQVQGLIDDYEVQKFIDEKPSSDRLLRIKFALLGDMYASIGQNKLAKKMYQYALDCNNAALRFHYVEEAIKKIDEIEAMLRRFNLSDISMNDSDNNNNVPSPKKLKTQSTSDSAALSPDVTPMQTDSDPKFDDLLADLDLSTINDLLAEIENLNESSAAMDTLSTTTTTATNDNAPNRTNTMVVAPNNKTDDFIPTVEISGLDYSKLNENFKKENFVKKLPSTKFTPPPLPGINTKFPEFEEKKEVELSTTTKFKIGHWGEEVIYNTLKHKWTKKYGNPDEFGNTCLFQKKDGSLLKLIWNNKDMEGTKDSKVSHDITVMKQNADGSLKKIKCVEVKTTRSMTKAEINLSSNQLQEFKEYGDNYRLVVVFAAGSKHTFFKVLENPGKKIPGRSKQISELVDGLTLEVPANSR